MNTLYLLSPLAQEKETHKYCFGKCKKIIVGGIDFMDAPWLPCREKECPHLEKEINMGEGEIRGEKENIFVRKLIN